MVLLLFLKERIFLMAMSFNVWALSDLHLSFGTQNKSMEVFGPLWSNYTEKIKENWTSVVGPEDLVLIAGDISWAMNKEEVMPDLEWIDRLPGTKLMIKGNHDYWWPSSSKLAEMLPPSIHFIHNNAFHWNNISFAGSRLWDTSEYSFPKEGRLEAKEVDEKIFQRELVRLETSLKALDQTARLRIALTHYPPIGYQLQPSKASELLERYNVTICVFGHLHALEEGKPLFGSRGPIRYILTACDYLKFHPLRIV